MKMMLLEQVKLLDMLKPVGFAVELLGTSHPENYINHRLKTCLLKIQEIKEEAKTFPRVSELILVNEELLKKAFRTLRKAPPRQLEKEISKTFEQLLFEMERLFDHIQLEHRYLLEHPKLAEAGSEQPPPPSLDKVKQPSEVEIDSAKVFLQMLDNSKRIVRQYEKQGGKVNQELLESLAENTLLSTGLLTLRCPELSHQLSEIHHLAKDQALHARLENPLFMLMFNEQLKSLENIIRKWIEGGKGINMAFCLPKC